MPLQVQTICHLSSRAVDRTGIDGELNRYLERGVANISENPVEERKQYDGNDNSIIGENRTDVGMQKNA